MNTDKKILSQLGKTMKKPGYTRAGPKRARARFELDKDGNIIGPKKEKRDGTR